MERLEIVRPERFAHGFNHFNRHDTIEGAVDITVVAQFEPNFAFHTTSRMRPSANANCSADKVTPFTFGIAGREISRANPDRIQSRGRRCRSDVQKFRDARDLPCLRVFERVETSGIQCGRIAHARVEPALVERIAEIVVKRNILAAAGPRVGAGEMAQAGDQAGGETPADLRF